MQNLVDRVLAGPAWLLVWLLALVAALVLSTYLRPRYWRELQDRGLADRARAATRVVARSVWMWSLPFGLGITLTFALAISMGERFDRLPYPVLLLIAIYGVSSLLLAWLLRRLWPRYRRLWDEVHRSPG